jgi:hypothetical protein
MDYHPWITAHCSTILPSSLAVLVIVIAVGDVIRRRRPIGKRSCGTVLPFLVIVCPLPPSWLVVKIGPIVIVIENLSSWEEKKLNANLATKMLFILPLHPSSKGIVPSPHPVISPRVGLDPAPHNTWHVPSIRLWHWQYYLLWA